ncbi:FxSxx-COOH system tetratricopeptide repeat protein [Sphaerisporangium aureirubrum]|uniref:FxSxx-COOH system tetratricopeptide repeat protein n=1 Tax=Sphaerisporangium aureirubrum TaxID=1544736 RepID=A0ABW1NIF6_9ACTN
MSESRDGQIITFYSFKGGTGRTMALANVAWILAANGFRVLVIDWDLESPGLHKFFRPFLNGEVIAETPGVIDLLTEYSWAATRDTPRPADWHLEYAKVKPHAIPVNWDHFPSGGGLDFLSAGLQNRDYSSLVSSFDWDNLYERLGGGPFFDALRDDMRANYDYVLIDSRTGLSDIADICTVHFPDVLITCFTLNDQSIEGAASVAGRIADRYPERIRVLPVPMRVDDAEKEKLDAGRVFARSQFERFPLRLSPDETVTYWGAVEVPYKPFYAYEETLATFGDEPGSPTSLLAAYERLVDVITAGRVRSLPALREDLRLRYRELFMRRRPVAASDVYINYVAEDRLWVDWITALLTQAGLRVHPQRMTSEADVTGNQPVVEPLARAVTLLSSAYLRSSRAREAWRLTSSGEFAGLGGSHIPVRVAEVQVPHLYADSALIDLVQMSETQAAAAFFRALDPPMRVSESDLLTALPRYPGMQPAVLNLPTRNATFTGRIEILERLRDQLVGGSQAVVTQELPQAALFGLGGIGKTQLALEYAHRFMTDYDVVWWVSAEQAELLNVAMADLAEKLDIRMGDNVAEAAQAAKEALRRGHPHSRWLLIFDNADDPKELMNYLPGGSGHVVITSRNPTWSEIATPLEITVFTREESKEHLRRRVPKLTAVDADRVADQLGDLPLAIEQAGAWLHETGMAVDEYLERLTHQPTQTLALGDTPLSYPWQVAAAWNVSFERLSQRSRAAARLLQLLAFFAADPVSLSMLYGDETVRCLVSYDESLAEKIMIGRLIRELNRFALAKVDQRDRSVQVHRLVQAVLRDQMNEDEREDTMHDVHRILLGARPREGDTDDPENWARYDEIWPHLLPSQAETCDEEPTRQLLIDRVRYFWKRGEFERALEFGRRLERIWITKLGDFDRQTLYLRFQMANVLRSQGRYQDACDLDRAVMADQQRVLDDSHPHTLMTAGGLAADLRALGELEESLRLEQETYARTKEFFGEGHHRTLMAGNNLAVSLRHMGGFPAARDLDQETLYLRREVLSSNHPYTLFSQNNLALDMRETGEYAQSVELLRSTLESYERVLGPDLVDTLRTARSLAVSLRRAGWLAEARQMTEKAYQRYLERYGPASPETIACKLNLAGDKAVTGDEADALVLISEVLLSYERDLGESNPYTLVAANNKTIYLRLNRDPGRARELGERTLSLFTGKLGVDHPFTLCCAVNLANVLGDLRDHASEERLLRETLERLTRVQGQRHPNTLVCRANLAVAERALGREDKAHGAREEVLDELRHILGEKHPVVTALLEWRRVDRDLEPMPW